ncbi:HEPN domain-containing protein [Spectribacter hydrogenoxidans]|uniref:HEPN domain-containing protein n=1 Tax=Spectribacter hydrogenoxidans TaxID=3075608 RepID=A0ABU3BZZ0_9GAMM|nr:HEPN domain-containing protein [Salinisphaera sp. W335]MDT0634874.1 HEPN domain-containing protein [Salinisphaera sp. W335]
MTDAIPDHATLKTYQRTHRVSFPEGLALRAHRGLSWLDRANQCDDEDGRFVFLWIAFNAAYAQNLSGLGRTSEPERIQQFFTKLESLDENQRLYELVWQRYAGPIRNLLNNKYVYQPFWDSLNHDEPDGDWEARFSSYRKAANAALAAVDTPRLLSIVFQALYTLRNQIVHGGATWNGRVNRPQISLGNEILADIVPIALDLMMRHPDTLWGDALYPVIER